MDRLTAFWLDLRRAARWHRRLLAAGLAAAGVAFGLQALAPPEPELVTLMSAARDLPGGEVPTADDLRQINVPAGLVPAGALHPTDDVARLLAGPMRAGETLTDAAFVSPSSVDRYGSELVATTVQLGDSTIVSLLRPGDRVDIVAAQPGAGSARRVAISAAVITIPTQQGAASSSTPSTIVVAVAPEVALDLAAAHQDSYVSVVLLPTAR